MMSIRSCSKICYKGCFSDSHIALIAIMTAMERLSQRALCNAAWSGTIARCKLIVSPRTFRLTFVAATVAPRQDPRHGDNDVCPCALFQTYDFDRLLTGEYAGRVRRASAPSRLASRLHPFQARQPGAKRSLSRRFVLARRKRSRLAKCVCGKANNRRRLSVLTRHYLALAGA